MNRLLRVSVVLIVLLVAPPAGGEALEVVIEAAGLTPSVMQVPAEEPVVFVNRSGETVHVEFVHEDGSHHLFQVTGRIWAVFHRSGRHEYVVHLARRPELRGAVDVAEAAAPAGLPVCSSITVMGVCLER